MIPWVREWDATFAGEDFEIVAVHYPEFRYEREPDNVRQAIIDLAIEYPVALDNQGVTWRAFGQRFWPTRHLIDKEGRLRYKHIGEGAYDETEAAIRALLAEPAP